MAILGFSLLWVFSRFQVTFKNIVIFLVFTYLIDLDSIISTGINHISFPETREIIIAFKTRRFKEMATLATIHHKKFNRLLLHNFSGFFVFLVFFAVSICRKYDGGILAFGAILFHFIFDIVDDLYQLGHIKNWFWR